MNIYLYAFIALMFVSMFILFIDYARKDAYDYDEQPLPPFPVYVPHLSPKKEWVGLTDDERDEIYNRHSAWVHAVEAKLKEKNAA